MLSILIPIYNYNAENLVKQLHLQALEADILFEILLLDDASDNTDCRLQNARLHNLEHVKLFELPTKAGRSVSRNYLAVQAKYDYLLFLDCDSEPPDRQFIKRYLPFCNGENVVVCGGTAYKSKKPDRDSYLRWTYGVKVETTSAQERSQNPNSRFSTFNFLISKRLFDSIRFNELLKNYGHEDTVFGLELKRKGYTIQHIDNPLYHTGIDPTEVYLDKTHQGVQNLLILLKQFPDQKELIAQIRLLWYYNILQGTHTVWLGYALHSIFKKLTLSNLRSKHPNMLLFNLYKLGYLCSLKYQKIVEI